MSKLILIDDSATGPTAIMLEGGIRAIKAEGGILDLDIVSLEHIAGLNYQVPADVSAIIVTVPERDLSLISTQNARRPCDTLSTAQCLAVTQVKPVHIVIASNPSVGCGVDISSALVAGIAGVHEERSLTSKDVVSQIATFNPDTSRYRTMLLIGNTVELLQTIKNTLTAWDEYFDSGSISLLTCWKVGTALAQLPKLEPIIGGGQPLSYLKLADALNLAYATTGFKLNNDDLRRIIGQLSEHWLGDEHNTLERTQLPDIARRKGFSYNPPSIIGLTDDQAIKRLYNATAYLQFISGQSLSTFQHGTVRLPRRRYLAYLPQAAKI